MTEIEVVQEIHKLFEVQPKGDELLKNKPEKMSSELFLALEEKYRLYYPANNFITEKQVEKICKKYGLVLGPELLFTDYIPKRAAKEISTFRLRETDSTVQNMKMLFELLIEANTSANIYYPDRAGGEGTVTL